VLVDPNLTVRSKAVPKKAFRRHALRTPENTSPASWIAFITQYMLDIPFAIDSSTAVHALRYWMGTLKGTVQCTGD
jgi:hypothetical protein